MNSLSGSKKDMEEKLKEGCKMYLKIAKKSIKKIFAISSFIITAILICMMFTGCSNKQMVDMTWNFNYGIIRMADGTIVEGKVTSWKDFENSDQIQVKIDDVTYLVHSSNITLMHKSEE